MTTATGLVDAVSVLGLGRVFVANMTGNVVFLGFAAAGVPGFALGASLAALAGFVVGALMAGPLVAARGANRGRLLLDTTLVELVLFLVAVGLLAPVSGPRAAHWPRWSRASPHSPSGCRTRPCVISRCPT
jgi:uncharacterized membrane protein YoaK (UPF0700 family)